MDGLFFHQFTKIAHQLTKSVIPVTQSAIRRIKESQKTILVTANSQIKVIQVTGPVQELFEHTTSIEPVFGTIEKYTYCYENIINPYTDLKSVAAKYDGYTLKNKIPHFTNNSITVNYEHILARQLKRRISKMGAESINCSIHHDYLNYFEKNDHIQLINNQKPDITKLIFGLKE